MNPYEGVVDQEALVEALKNGQIAAAGLDVMTPEPLPAGHELTKMKNCGNNSHFGYLKKLFIVA